MSSNKGYLLHPNPDIYEYKGLAWGKKPWKDLYIIYIPTPVGFFPIGEALSEKSAKSYISKWTNKNKGKLI